MPPGHHNSVTVSDADSSATELLPTELVNLPGSTSHRISMFQNANASGLFGRERPVYVQDAVPADPQRLHLYDLLFQLHAASTS